MIEIKILGEVGQAKMYFTRQRNEGVPGKNKSWGRGEGFQTNKNLHDIIEV